LATTFASSLAWAITWLGNKSAWAPWRLLFLVEGFPSCIVAYWVFRSLPDGPESAKFLTRREKEIAQARLKGENSEEVGMEKNESGQKKRKLKFNEILEALKDPKCYLTAVSLHSHLLLVQIC
jgi:hypothetical protein